MSPRRETGAADELTWREHEILLLLAERLTNREIAARLHLAESTVKDYVGKILSKLYVKNRRQAVRRARALGLLAGEARLEALPEAGSTPPANAPPARLPAEPSPFVGRREELTQIARLLEGPRRQAGPRLLTLTGPGGMGKTRLALQAARAAAAGFTHGCTFVPLAPISTSAHLAQTIAEALKYPLATLSDPRQQLLRYLGDKELLLVLDNFEHLLDGAGLISTILEAAPGVKILATSRERLNLQGETLLNVSGMGYPDPAGAGDGREADALELFVARARQLRPGFEPDPTERDQIARICRSVGGMPLAIELAAAWLGLLNVAEIAAELAAGPAPGPGLDLLASGPRDAPERHRSMRAVFDHSWALLEPRDQEIFTRLSVFRGGFSRAAAQQVTGAGLPQLARLVDKSLLQHDPGAGRLEVHELLRQYAQERLEAIPGAAAAARNAHAAYFAGFMEQRWAQLKDTRQLTAQSEIETDIENIRAAWRCSLAQANTPRLWKFIYSLWRVYWMRWWNHAGMQLFAEAVRSLPADGDEETTALRAFAMALQANFMGWLDQAEQGYELSQASVSVLTHFDHPEALALAYESLAINAYFISRYSEQIKAAEQMFRIAARIEDKWLLAFALFATSMGALQQADYAEARRMAARGLSLTRESGDVVGSAMALINLGHVALMGAEPEKADGIYRRALEISTRIDFPYGIQTVTKYLVKVNLALGQTEAARNYLMQSLAITREIGFGRDLINLLYEFARLRAAEGRLVHAAELLALVIRHPLSAQSRWAEGRIRDSARELLARLETELPAEAYAAAVTRGQELELEAVIAALAGSEARRE